MAKLKHLDSFHKTVSQARLFLAAVSIQPHLLELQWDYDKHGFTAHTLRGTRDHHHFWFQNT